MGGERLIVAAGQRDEDVMRAESVEELETYLREFTSWSDPDVYDFGANAHLLAACLDSLRTRALDAELEELGEYLTDAQSDFLFRVVELMSGYRDSREG